MKKKTNKKKKLCSDKKVKNKSRLPLLIQSLKLQAELASTDSSGMHKSKTVKITQK